MKPCHPKISKLLLGLNVLLTWYPDSFFEEAKLSLRRMEGSNKRSTYASRVFWCGYQTVATQTGSFTNGPWHEVEGFPPELQIVKVAGGHNHCVLLDGNHPTLLHYIASISDVINHSLSINQHAGKYILGEITRLVLGIR